MKKAPALLSFFLPGLGQLAQKRYVWAVGFFLPFAIVTALRVSPWLVPLIAIASGLETLRFPNLGQITDKNLRYAYGAVGGIGFLAWFSLVASIVLPFGRNVHVNRDVEYIRFAFKSCYSPHASNNEVVLACIRNGKSSTLTDPWGTPYYFDFADGTFEIRSLGRDKQMRTEDDLVYRSPVKAGY